MNALGALSLTILNESSIKGSSIAALWLPTPIPMPSSSAAPASVAFTALVSGCPPVIDAINMGARNFLSRNSVSRLDAFYLFPEDNHEQGLYHQNLMPEDQYYSYALQHLFQRIIINVLSSFPTYSFHIPY